MPLKRLLYYQQITGCSLAALFIAWYSYLYFQKQLDFSKLQTILQQPQANKEQQPNKILDSLNANILPHLRLEINYFQFVHLLENHQWQQAQEYGQQINKFAPGYYQTEYYLAWLKLQQGQPKEALDYIEKALDLHPMEEKNQQLKSHILQKLGKIDEAKQCQKNYLELKQRNADFQEN